MKYLTFLITLLSISFAQPWVSFDLKWEADFEGVYDLEADDGAITIGYEFPVNKDMNFGFAYDIKGAKFDGGTDDATCMNLYSKYFFSSDSDMSFWGTLGYTIPTGDFDDVDGGLNYGFGMLHNNGIGFYFIINDLEYSETIYNDYNNSYELEADVKITRIGLSWTFKDKEE